MSRHVAMSVRAVVLERLLADPVALDILLSDSDHYDAARDILWRKDNMPALGSFVYTDNCYGDTFEQTVLEHHMDWSITVTDNCRKERLTSWRLKP